MFDLFNKIKKKAFEEGYKAGYALAEAEGKQNALVERIDSYNHGYFDGMRSGIKRVYCGVTPYLVPKKKTTKKKTAKKGK